MAKVDKALKREGNSFTKRKSTIMDRDVETGRDRQRWKSMIQKERTEEKKVLRNQKEQEG